MVAAGVAFYAFFAVFPALAAVVSIYGLIADPQTVEQQLNALGQAVPSGARDILASQLKRIASSSGQALGWGLVISLLLALWSANKGTRGMIEALNIAYGEEEKRGTVKLTALSLLLTLGAVLTAVIAILIVVGIPAVFAVLGLHGAGRVAIELLRWPILLGLLLAGLAVLYRLAPSREGPPWRWVTPGSLLSTGLWLVASIAFSIYVANFGNYDKTFGSLGAVAILLMWLYVGSYVVLLGAELNVTGEERAPPAGSAHTVGR
jgi:membrane protein